MKKIFKVLLSFILLSLSSCNEPICEEQPPSTDLATVYEETFIVHLESAFAYIPEEPITHGKSIIHLKDSNNKYMLFDYDYHQFNIDMLHNGEKIKISYTGEIKEVDRKFVIENGSIQNIEVIEKANRYPFELYNVPGADPYYFDIVYKGEDKSLKFKFNENFFYINKELDYVSFPYGYNGLKLYGVDNPNSYSMIEDDFIHISSLHVLDEYIEPDRSEYEQQKLNTILINNYIEKVYLAINFMYTSKYGYVIESANYRKTFQNIEKNKKHKTEFFSFNQYDCEGIYEIEDNITTLYHSNGVRYVSNDNINLEINNEFERAFNKIYSKHIDTTFKNNETYDDYRLVVNQIDPCCNGPIESISFINQKYDYLSFNIRIVDDGKELESLITIDKNKYISYEEYYEKMILQASKINIDTPYQLLDKFDNVDNENLLYEFGFGIYSFIEKKYESFDNYSKVFYSVTSYPDYFYSLGNHITIIAITDPNVSFDGFSLNSSKEEIINYYMSLGYKVTEENVLSLNGIMINILEKDGNISSIIYSCNPTNVMKVVF